MIFMISGTNSRLVSGEGNPGKLFENDGLRPDKTAFEPHTQQLDRPEGSHPIHAPAGSQRFCALAEDLQIPLIGEESVPLSAGEFADNPQLFKQRHSVGCRREGQSCAPAYIRE